MLIDQKASVCNVFDKAEPIFITYFKAGEYLSALSSINWVDIANVFVAAAAALFAFLAWRAAARANQLETRNEKVEICEVIYRAEFTLTNSLFIDSTHLHDLYKARQMARYYFSEEIHNKISELHKLFCGISDLNQRLRQDRPPEDKDIEFTEQSAKSKQARALQKDVYSLVEKDTNFKK